MGFEFEFEATCDICGRVPQPKELPILDLFDTGYETSGWYMIAPTGSSSAEQSYVLACNNPECQRVAKDKAKQLWGI